MRALVLAMMLGFSALAAPALAQPAKQPTAAQLYAEGEALFKAGRLEDAIEAFSRGYALDPQPAFLLNLAQCYRALGRRADAILHFERFIRAAPDDPLRPNAERTLEELRRAEAVERIANKPQQPVVVAELPPPDKPRDAPRSSNTWLWVAAGAVLVLGGGTAIYFATRSSPGPDDTIRLPPP